MERPQSDREFQCVHELHALSLITPSVIFASHPMLPKKMFVTMLNVISHVHSCIFKRSIQQVPVLQHAGFPPEGHSRESESAPVCQRQPGLPAAVGVSFLLPEKEAKSPKKFSVLLLFQLTHALNLLLVPSFFFTTQSGGAAGQRPAD